MQLKIKLTERDIRKLLRDGKLIADEMDIILELIKDAPPKY
jgi:hypothetical protein